MMKLHTLFLFTSFFFIGCTSSRPLWIEETPKGYENDYFVGNGTSDKSETDAHEQAVTNAIQRINQSGEIEVSSSEKTNSNTKETFRNGTSDLQRTDEIAKEILVQGKSTTINGLVEDERFHEWNGAQHSFWSLVKIPKKNNIESSPTKFSPVWRSAIIPGWGQYFKGEKTKGYSFIGAEVLLVPSGIIFNNLGVDAEANKFSSRTQTLRDYYDDQSKLYYNVSLGCFIAAGAVYVYNVVDAISSDWKIYSENSFPRIEWNEKKMSYDVRFTIYNW